MKPLLKTHSVSLNAPGCCEISFPTWESERHTILITKTHLSFPTLGSDHELKIPMFEITNLSQLTVRKQCSLHFLLSMWVNWNYGSMIWYLELCFRENVPKCNTKHLKTHQISSPIIIDAVVLILIISAIGKKLWYPELTATELPMAMFHWRSNGSNPSGLKVYHSSTKGILQSLLLNTENLLFVNKPQLQNKYLAQWN